MTNQNTTNFSRPDADACLDCHGLSDLVTVIEGEEQHLCDRCARKRGFTECAKCGGLFAADELVTVQTCRATHSSPAESDEICLECAGGGTNPEPDWDAIRDERDGF